MKIKFLKDLINKIFLWYIRFKRKKSYLNDYKEILRTFPELSYPSDGEQEWLNKWRKYDKNISPLSYRIFSRYIGNDINIIPLEFCANFIEPVLNPTLEAVFYNDKNSFALLYNKEILPKTFIHNVGGFYLDENYRAIKIENLYDYLKGNVILIKPSKESSGRGINIYHKLNNDFVDKNGNKLNIEYLNRVYGSDFLIQEWFEQSDFMLQFNTSSVNTIRIAMYRDVVTGDIKYLRGIVRIGGNGSIVDNAHAGGRFIGIDDNGKFGKYLCDNIGRKYKEHNGIDFSKSDYIIPNFENIKIFAKQVSEKFIHHGLFALDIVLDKNNKPKLLELNVSGFSAWLFQFTSGTAFREYTDDIVTYCLEKRQKIRMKIRTTING